MLDHFAECIKQAKGVRQQAVQLNIFTAVLSALKVRKLHTVITKSCFIAVLEHSEKHLHLSLSDSPEGFG